LEIAKKKLQSHPNVVFHATTIDDMPLEDNSQDFGYCLGVLHHIPDTERAMQICVDKLKPGSPFLVYMYYNFENKPLWFRAIWKCTDVVRRTICRLPNRLKKCLTDTIALCVYWPMARLSFVLEKIGFNVRNFPLSSYRNGSFYNMRNCALDRFGTCLEKRFSRVEIRSMMEKCGLEEIRFGHNPNCNWVAVGVKR
jgi:SAM-dependent methyltransferase